MHRHQSNVEENDTCGNWRDDFFKISNPKYVAFDARLSSFEKWPQCLRYQSHNLAEAGLYYTGRGDEVRCFSCGGVLKNWTESDAPFEQHILWYPKCDFLNVVKGTTNVQQIREKYVVKPE